MKLIISPKDNINKIELEVETFAQEGRTLLVIFPDGRARSYPMEHLWYWQGDVPAGAGRSKPPEGAVMNRPPRLCAYPPCGDEAVSYSDYCRDHRCLGPVAESGDAQPSQPLSPTKDNSNG